MLFSITSRSTSHAIQTLSAQVYYYNFGWKDYGHSTLQGLLNVVKVMAFASSQGKIAIHCHAG